MNDPTITEFFTTLADAKERVDRRRAEIEKLQAEIKQLREQLSAAASAAATLRLTANAAYENIVTTIDEIEINRIMTTEERNWVNRLRRTAKNLDPYPDEHTDE